MILHHLLTRSRSSSLASELGVPKANVRIPRIPLPTRTSYPLLRSHPRIRRAQTTLLRNSKRGLELRDRGLLCNGGTSRVMKRSSSRNGTNAMPDSVARNLSTDISPMIRGWPSRLRETTHPSSLTRGGATGGATDMNPVRTAYRRCPHLLRCLLVLLINRQLARLSHRKRMRTSKYQKLWMGCRSQLRGRIIGDTHFTPRSLHPSYHLLLDLRICRACRSTGDRALFKRISLGGL